MSRGLSFARCPLAGPAAGLNPHPETVAQRFCAAVSSPFSGFIALFTNVSHFYLSVVLQQHYLKPSQQHHSTVSKAFQTVSLSLPYFPILLSFYAICRDYICIFWAFYPFLGIFSGTFPLVDRAQKVCYTQIININSGIGQCGPGGLCSFYNM